MTAARDWPDGPRPLPLIGNALDFWREGPEVILRYVRDYGDLLMGQLGPSKIFLVSDPDLIRRILVKDNANFTKGRALQLLQRTLGVGQLTAHPNAEYARVRQALLPFFLPERIETYSRATMAAVTRFETSITEGRSFDVGQEMAALCLTVGGNYMLGVDLWDTAHGLTDDIFEIVVISSKLNLLPESLQNLPLPRHFRLRQLQDRLDQAAGAIIERRRAADAAPPDMLSTLMAPELDLSAKALRDQVVTLAFAGFEAPSITLSWAWHLLGRHPRALAELRAELDAVLAGRAPSHADLPHLPLARGVIAETMRLRPPVWVMARQVLNPYPLREFLLPAGSEILMSPYVLQRDPRYFSDPLSFDPTRWTRPMSHPKFAYFPFGGGARACSGEQFSWASLTLIVAALAQNWDFTPQTDAEVPPALTLTLKPRDPIIVTPRRRSPTAKPD